jgi:hypothetical protein
VHTVADGVPLRAVLGQFVAPRQLVQRGAERENVDLVQRAGPVLEGLLGDVAVVTLLRWHGGVTECGGGVTVVLRSVAVVSRWCHGVWPWRSNMVAVMFQYGVSGTCGVTTADSSGAPISAVSPKSHSLNWPSLHSRMLSCHRCHIIKGTAVMDWRCDTSVTLLQHFCNTSITLPA